MVETNLPGWGNGLRQRHYGGMNELNEEGVYALAAAEKKSTNASAFWPEAVGTLERERRQVKYNSPSVRAGMLARLTRMSVRYISRDVCQNNCILSHSTHPNLFFWLQDLSKIIKSDKSPGKDYLVVDVRDSDFIGGHIPNCRNEPSTTFLDTLDDLVRDTKGVPQVIFHCALSQSRWVSHSTHSLSTTRI
jgi:hypothetical protein